MFDFNSINHEINNKSNDVFNEISLDLLDINPCALFYSLYDVPITGNKVGNSEFFTIDNIINENIHDNFISCEILKSFIFNSDTTAKFKLVNSIISNNDGIDILYNNTIQEYRKLFSLGVYPYIYKFQEYKNDFFHIVYIGKIDSCTDHFYISLNKENIINKKLSNTVINYINDSSDYKKIINNIAKSLDYNSYFKYIVTDIKSDKGKNKSNVLLKKKIFKFYFNKNNKTAYFIYTIRNIFPIEFNISNSYYTNEFRHLLSLSNRPAFQAIKDNMYKNYEFSCKLNDDKEVQIKITDDLQNIPDYVKFFYKINWKERTSHTDKLRALTFKLL
jgi:hypothetical protein|nr:MAG TPA: hypothetical protein [Caudoviricetes sp.]